MLFAVLRPVTAGAQCGFGYDFAIKGRFQMLQLHTARSTGTALALATALLLCAPAAALAQAPGGLANQDALIDAVEPKVIAWRHIHQNPELSFQVYGVSVFFV